MADYLPLPTVTTTAAADQTGQNTGNLTNHFTTAVLTARVATFEVYHAVVTSVPDGASGQVNIGTRAYSFTFPFGGAEWDPAQPMLLQAGQEVYFLWSVSAATTPAPVVTLYLRYDPALPGNGYPSSGGSL